MTELRDYLDYSSAPDQITGGARTAATRPNTTTPGTSFRDW